MPPHVLIVEDDAHIRDLIVLHLGLEGLQSTAVGDGRDALDRVSTTPYDLVVLDLMLPGVDGISICRALRRSGPNQDVPVLMLTARREESDKVLGLESGADDYLAKPFEPQELLLRVEAILRRAGPRAGAPREVRLGDCLFDLERLELSRDGRPIRLTEAEGQLLKTLALSAHAPVDRYALAPESVDAAGRAVDVQVTRLRRKIEADPKNPRYLQTVRGVGYMLAPD